jgi:CheY-like chemotaxis protein
VQSVLIVDDDLDILGALADLLESEGYHVTTVTDGQAALSYLRRGLRPCVILLDLMMPGMNGWDFRAEQFHPELLRSAVTLRPFIRGGAGVRIAS